MTIIRLSNFYFVRHLTLVHDQSDYYFYYYWIVLSTIGLIDNTALKKKLMHSCRWGLSRQAIGLLYLRHFSIMGFSSVLTLSNHNELRKARLRYRLLYSIPLSLEQNEIQEENIILHIKMIEEKMETFFYHVIFSTLRIKTLYVKKRDIIFVSVDVIISLPFLFFNLILNQFICFLLFSFNIII